MRLCTNNTTNGSKKLPRKLIRRFKKYTDVRELTREMALELIEYITVDAYAADRPRDIYIYYKLLDKPLPHKRYIEVGKGAVEGEN